MGSTDIEVFRQREISEDHGEAHVINRYFDQLANEGFEGDILTRAIEMAHQELTPITPAAENFGYPVAKAGLRWLHFRGAMLKDQTQRGSVSGNVLRSRQRRQERAEEQILARQDPVYTIGYAALTGQRLEEERQGKRVRNPFDREKKFFASMPGAIALAAASEEPGRLYNGPLYPALAA